MYTGSLGAVSNQEDWIVNISLIASDGTPYLMTGAVITLHVTDPDRPKSPILQTSSATITISADSLTLTWVVPAATMNSYLPAGDYSVFSRMTLNGITSQLISASVSVVEGGPT